VHLSPGQVLARRGLGEYRTREPCRSCERTWFSAGIWGEGLREGSGTVRAFKDEGPSTLKWRNPSIARHNLGYEHDNKYARQVHRLVFVIYKRYGRDTGALGGNWVVIG